MKIKPEQLKTSVNGQNYPAYLITGDEPVLVQEQRDTVRQFLLKAGYQNREVFYPESNFNWDDVLIASQNRSLFAERTLIEINAQTLLNEGGKKALLRVLTTVGEDTVLLLILPRLDAAQQRATWFRQFDQVGLIVQVWPFNNGQFTSWLRARLERGGITLDASALKFLSDRLNGNLAAAVQEVEKLQLFYGEGHLTLKQLNQAVVDNSRYTVFSLIDAMLLGQLKLMDRIMFYLQTTEEEPALLLWSCVKELRALWNMRVARDAGEQLDIILRKAGVWFNRKAVITHALTHLNLAQLAQALQLAAEIDQIIKGVDSVNRVWHRLGQLYWLIGKFCAGRG